MQAGRGAAAPERGPDEFSAGVLIGLLVGEGHFGGDGRQPQVTLRMHVRHEKLFRWLQRVFPEGRLYGPYHHGGRDYYQWMARGDFLRRRLVPLVREHLPRLDDYAAARFRSMCERYRLETGPAEPLPPAGARGPGERRLAPRERKKA